MPVVLGTSKITSKGQITIPVELRRLSGFAPGERVAFVRDGGSLMLIGNDLAALGEFGEAFRGAAEEAGLETEQDVVDMINALRSGKDV